MPKTPFETVSVIPVPLRRPQEKLQILQLAGLASQ